MTRPDCAKKTAEAGDEQAYAAAEQPVKVQDDVQAASGRRRPGKLREYLVQLEAMLSDRTLDLRALARGAAVGAFSGFAFPPGVQTLAALGIAARAKANPLMAAIFAWVTNPFTTPIIYPIGFFFGSFLLALLPMQPEMGEAIGLDAIEASGIGMYRNVAAATWLGLVVLGVGAAAASYYGTTVFAKAFRSDKQGPG